jgi:DNA-binding GntR family transcriptional regulator
MLMNTQINLQLREHTEKERLSDVVYETLLDAILSAELPPGTVLSEVSLARTLKVSRTPVHDALRQLAKDGLVEQQANRRAVVARFSREDFYEIFEMRKLLEGEAARRAATRIDRPTLVNLQRMAQELADSRGTPDWVARWTDYDEVFHQQIAEASGSKRLANDIMRYRQFHRGFNKLATNGEDLQQAMTEHARILEALENRDPEAAAAAMIAHIQEWQAYFANRVNQREST